MLNRLVSYNRTAEFRQLAERVKTIADEDWKTRVVRGITGTGDVVPDAVGVRERRKGKYRGKTGMPGTPSASRSRLAANYRSRLDFAGSGFTYLGTVEGFPAAIHVIRRYHYGGISPRARRRIAGLASDSVLRLVRSG